MSTAYRHTLAPVLGVMVAGHRHGRLSLYGVGPENGAPDERALTRTLSRVLSSLRVEATEAFRRGQPVYDDQPAECRLLTGVANGTDELAANLALSFADVLIAIWDGQEPFPMSSGTALAVKSALLRRTPVIWLDISHPDQPPQIRMTEMHRLTDSALTELEVLGATPDMISALFSHKAPEDIEAHVRDWFDALLVPFAPALSSANQEQRLRRRVNQQLGVLRYTYRWLRYGMSRLGSGKKSTVEPPIGPLRWLKGGVLWFRIMLNPPRHSSATFNRSIINCTGITTTCTGSR